MTVVVSLEHMRAAAASWQVAGDHLRAASGMADGLKISRMEAGIFQAAWDAYTEAATYIVARLNEGSAEAASIGTVLCESADTYEREDGTRAQALNGIGATRAG
jgi:hypothetical protein